MQPFEFVAPRSVDETLRLLGRNGDGAALLAGGQSLMILLRQGLANPELVIGLKDVAELRTVEAGADGLRLGSMVTYATVAGDPRIAAGAPTLAAAAGSVGSVHIRNLGTLGGSVCHADPAGDVPTVLLTLDATLRTASPDGTTAAHPVDGFFLGLFETRLAPGELLISIDVPARPAGSTFGYRRFSFREGEYPMAVAACTLSWEDGRCAGARVAVGGGGPHPMRLMEVERLLTGLTAAEAAEAAAALRPPGSLRPIADVRGSEAWKTRVLADLLRGTIADALPPGR